MALLDHYRFIRGATRQRLALHAFTLEQPDGLPSRPRQNPPAPPKQPKLVFYDFPSSPFCIKVRALLHWKGLRFTAVDPLEMRHWLQLQRHGTGKVPALKIDGRLVSDSSAVALELERLAPDRPVLPAAAHARALNHALEEWADEAIYFTALYHLWLHPAGHAQVAGLFGRGLLGRLSYHFYLHRIRQQLRGQGTARKPRVQIEQDLLQHLDSAQALLAPHAFLLGDQPQLADFALFGQLAFLLRSRASRPAMLARTRLVHYVDHMRLLCGPR